MDIMKLQQQIRLIAFDADDTLWDCQSHFDAVEAAYCKLLEPYGTGDAASAALFERETANMPLLGYGCKAFVISLVENAISFSKGRISAAELQKIVTLGKSLLQLEAAPLEGVEPALEALRQSGRYALAVFTKGELLDQENKLCRSGLKEYFDDVLIVSDKTEAAYRQLCRRHGVALHEFLMVGNSFKSDIEPVLRLGGYAAHIPFYTMWQHERTQEYSHEHLWLLRHFSELGGLVG